MLSAAAGTDAPVPSGPQLVNVFSFLRWAQKTAPLQRAPTAQRKNDMADHAVGPALPLGGAHIVRAPTIPTAPAYRLPEAPLLPYGGLGSVGLPTTAPSAKLVVRDVLQVFPVQSFVFSTAWPPKGLGCVPRVVADCPVGMSPFTYTADRALHASAIRREMDRAREHALASQEAESSDGDRMDLDEPSLVLGPKIQPGYCENCCENFKNLADHCNGEKHRRFEANPKNFERLLNFTKHFYRERELRVAPLSHSRPTTCPSVRPRPCPPRVLKTASGERNRRLRPRPVNHQVT
jgi:hypothetical protein